MQIEIAHDPYYGDTVMTIEGVRYAAELFTTHARITPPGYAFRIVKVDGDVVTIQTVRDGGPLCLNA